MLCMLKAHTEHTWAKMRNGLRPPSRNPINLPLNTAQSVTGICALTHLAVSERMQRHDTAHGKGALYDQNYRINVGVCIYRLLYSGSVTPQSHGQAPRSPQEKQPMQFCSLFWKTAVGTVTKNTHIRTHTRTRHLHISPPPPPPLLRFFSFFPFFSFFFPVCTDKLISLSGGHPYPVVNNYQKRKLLVLIPVATS